MDAAAGFGWQTTVVLRIVCAQPCINYIQYPDTCFFLAVLGQETPKCLCPVKDQVLLSPVCPSNKYSAAEIYEVVICSELKNNLGHFIFVLIFLKCYCYWKG